MTVTVRSASDFVAVIPSLLGCTPTDSIVTIGAKGNRVCLTARMDIPTGPAQLAEACQIAAQGMTNAGASTAWIITYQSSPDPAAAVAVAILTDMLTAGGITMAPAITVTGDPLHDATVTDSSSAAPAPLPTPIVHPLRPRAASRTRHDIEADIEAGPRAHQVAAHHNALARNGAPSPITMLAAVEQLRTADLTRVDDADVAALAWALGHFVHPEAPPFEPSWPTAHTDPLSYEIERADMLERLRQLVTCLPDDQAGDCLELLAYLAYLDGDGLIANIALDRAERTQPLSDTGHLVRTQLLTGRPPTRPV